VKGYSPIGTGVRLLPVALSVGFGSFLGVKLALSVGNKAVIATGLGGARLALRHGASPPRCLFVDLVYGTQPTPFLAAAVRAGRATLDGGPMLLHQGALAFETWTGRRAPLAAMARALGDAGLVLTQPRAARSVRARRPPRP